MIDPYLTQALVRYDGASDEDRAAGVAWYRNARREVRAIAAEHGVPFRQAAGIVAATSPVNSWQGNLTMAHNLLADPDKRLMRAHEPARAILRGTRPLAALQGPKVRPFYRAIAGDGNAAVVDRWMLRAITNSDSPSGGRRDGAAQALTAAAALRGVPTTHLQATIWIDIRGKAV